MQRPAQIHWFSIINSCVTVLLLTGFLATILMRVLKNDFMRFQRDDEGVSLSPAPPASPRVMQACMCRQSLAHHLPAVVRPRKSTSTKSRRKQRVRAALIDQSPFAHWWRVRQRLMGAPHEGQACVAVIHSKSTRLSELRSCVRAAQNAHPEKCGSLPAASCQQLQAAQPEVATARPCAVQRPTSRRRRGGSTSTATSSASHPTRTCSAPLSAPGVSPAAARGARGSKGRGVRSRQPARALGGKLPESDRRARLSLRPLRPQLQLSRDLKLAVSSGAGVRVLSGISTSTLLGASTRTACVQGPAAYCTSATLVGGGSSNDRFSLISLHP